MLGKMALTAGLAVSLVTIGSSAASAHHKGGSSVTPGTAVCTDFTLSPYATMKIVTSGISPDIPATWTFDGKVDSTKIQADTPQIYWYVPHTGVNTVTVTLSGVVVASCSATITGTIRPGF